MRPHVLPCIHSHAWESWTAVGLSTARAAAPPARVSRRAHAAGSGWPRGDGDRAARCRRVRRADAMPSTAGLGIKQAARAAGSTVSVGGGDSAEAAPTHHVLFPQRCLWQASSVVDYVASKHRPCSGILFWWHGSKGSRQAGGCGMLAGATCALAGPRLGQVAAPGTSLALSPRPINPGTRAMQRHMPNVCLTHDGVQSTLVCSRASADAGKQMIAQAGCPPVSTHVELVCGSGDGSGRSCSLRKRYISRRLRRRTEPSTTSPPLYHHRHTTRTNNNNEGCLRSRCHRRRRRRLCSGRVSL